MARKKGENPDYPGRLVSRNEPHLRWAYDSCGLTGAHECALLSRRARRNASLLAFLESQKREQLEHETRIQNRKNSVKSG